MYNRQVQESDPQSTQDKKKSEIYWIMKTVKTFYMHWSHHTQTNAVHYSWEYKKTH